jgi:hypothetical protein
LPVVLLLLAVVLFTSKLDAYMPSRSRLFVLFESEERLACLSKYMRLSNADWMALAT